MYNFASKIFCIVLSHVVLLLINFKMSALIRKSFFPIPLARSVHLGGTYGQGNRARVHVRYSSSPEYKAQFQLLCQELSKNFPNEVSVTGEALKAKSEDFEVAINDQIIHSKRLGDGFINKMCKRAVIVNGIKAALNRKK